MTRALVAKDIGKSSNCCSRLVSMNKYKITLGVAAGRLKDMTGYNFRVKDSVEIAKMTVNRPQAWARDPESCAS